MSRASVITLLLSAALGLGLGLTLGWVVAPVRYVDTHPSTLGQTHKDDYVLMVATIYAGDGDAAAARARLAALGFADPGAGVAAAAHRFIAARQPEADLRRLARLAAAFDAATPELLPYLPTPANPATGAP